METITETVRQLILLLLLASLLELLLPRGHCSRLVRLTMGLCLLATLLDPLAQRLSRDQPLEGLLPRQQQQQTAPALASDYLQQDYLQQGRELAAELQQQAGRQYGAQLAQQMSALAALAEGVEAARAEVQLAADGSLQTAKLYLQARPELAAQAAAAARQLVGGFYLLSDDQVVCVMETGMETEMEQ